MRIGVRGVSTLVSNHPTKSHHHREFCPVYPFSRQSRTLETNIRFLPDAGNRFASGASRPIFRPGQGSTGS